MEVPLNTRPILLLVVDVVVLLLLIGAAAWQHPHDICPTFLFLAPKSVNTNKQTTRRRIGSDRMKSQYHVQRSWQPLNLRGVWRMTKQKRRKTTFSSLTTGWNWNVGNVGRSRSRSRRRRRSSRWLERPSQPGNSRRNAWYSARMIHCNHYDILNIRYATAVRHHLDFGSVDQYSAPASRFRKKNKMPLEKINLHNQIRPRSVTFHFVERCNCNSKWRHFLVFEKTTTTTIIQ